MNRKLWYLKQLNLFKTLPQKEVEMLSRNLVMKEYGKRQVILEPVDSDKVFILKMGRVEVYELTPDGKKIIVDVLTPGNVFGDLGVEETNENFVEATANSLVCVMKKQEFFEMVSKNPAVSYQLIRELFQKTVEDKKTVAALASDSLLTKVKNLLLRLAKRYGEKKENTVTIAAKFTHEELADMVGISRPTMTELLNKLDRIGIIKRVRKIITFDPRKLAEYNILSSKQQNP
ncbi:MAG: Crp/Fnr family transcriptional regulator [Candidatus Levybacteria bacterium]|nr:Crp/Fnr family transcriptional regulator [Candidatus Levybacteria bacterium]